MRQWPRGKQYRDLDATDRRRVLINALVHDGADYFTALDTARSSNAEDIDRQLRSVFQYHDTTLIR